MPEDVEIVHLTAQQALRLERFREEICLPRQHNELRSESPEFALNDVLDNVNWYDMSIGWFLSEGCSVDEAEELARLARYTYQYWDDGSEIARRPS